MKTHVKKEMKKYPYHRKKRRYNALKEKPIYVEIGDCKSRKSKSISTHPIFAQIRAREQRIKEKLPQYAIIDDKGTIIEKYRLQNTAMYDLPKVQKNYYVKLRIVVLDENGEVTDKG